MWNVFSAEQIQFRAVNQEDFRYFGFINEENISICNPTSFYTSLNNFKIKMIFEGREIGELNFPRVMLAPNSDITMKGKFTTEVFEEAQYLSMHFDSMFMDTIATRINPTKMTINTEAQILIIGFIPFSVTKDYSALEFWEMMNSDENIC